MFGIEEWGHANGIGPQVMLLIGYGMLLCAFVATSILREVHAKDLARGDFVLVLILVLSYTFLLVSVEGLSIMLSAYEGLKDFLKAVQFAAYVGVMFHMFKSVVQNIRVVGITIQQLDTVLERDEVPATEKRDPAVQGPEEGDAWNDGK